MSYLVVSPEMLASAAADLARVGVSLKEVTAAAAAPTTTVLAAAGDEISTAVASLFSGYAAEYQAISVHIEAFHVQFGAALARAGSSYMVAEAASTSPLQTLADSVLAVVNAPTNALLGRPLIGDGASGASGTGAAGGAGGILWGSGGSGGSGAPGRPAALAARPA